MAGRALFLTYDPQVASFRHRLRPVADRLGERGWSVGIETLPKGRYLARLLGCRDLLRRADVVVIGKLLLALGEPLILRRWARRVVYDIDDAVFLRKPRRLGEEPDRSALRRRKFADTCRAADLVIAGNAFLRRAASPHCPRVEIVPTSVNVGDYPAEPSADRAPRTVVWIGRPENLGYLDLVRPALATLARRYPDLELRVICSSFPDWPEVPIERVPWSAATEAEALRTSGVGIMPLPDDDWARGKCAFKLLQYGAAGLPCVGSPVGANTEAILDAETGYLAATADDWTHALDRLLADPDHAARLGGAGRRHVEAIYGRGSAVRSVVDLLDEIR